MSSLRSNKFLRTVVVLAAFLICSSFSLIGSRAHAQLLVIAPHPDDDIITSAGVIYRARQAGVEVWVMYMTNGDYYPTGVPWGRQRADEAVAGQALLGVPADHLVFLGYPDESLQNLFGASYRSVAYVPATDPQNASDPRIQMNRQNQSNVTYTRTGSVPYSQIRTGAAVVNTGNNVLADLVHFLNARRPTDIFTVNENERNPNHRTTYSFLLEALTTVASYNPTVHRTAVWDDQTVWPPAPNATQYFPQMPPARQSRGDWGIDLPWGERESLDVPLIMQLTDFSQNLKARAINAHQTQGGFTGVKDGGHISSFVHKDEFFWTARASGTNRPPVPNAGLDQTASPGTQVSLDGSGSLAFDDALSYAWRQSEGPAVTLSNSAVVGPTFTLPNVAQGTILAFELRVRDSLATSVADAVSVRVGAAQPPDAGVDAGPPDAGPPDAGTQLDSGAPDGGSMDASAGGDASGSNADSGAQLDAGTQDTDAGAAADAAQGLDVDAEGPLTDAVVADDTSMADAPSPSDTDSGATTSAWPGDEDFEQDTDDVVEGDAGDGKSKPKKGSGCSLSAQGQSSGLSVSAFAVALASLLSRFRSRSSRRRSRA